MPATTVNYPIILIKGMNSTLIDEYILHTVKSINWTNDILTNINSKSDFSNLLTSTFGDNLITSNVSSSTFNKNNEKLSISLQYGVNNSGIIGSGSGANYYTPSDMLTPISNAGYVFRTKASKKPKTITATLLYNCDSSISTLRSWFALRYVGTTSNEVGVPISVIHPSPVGQHIQHGLYINNFENYVKESVTGWNEFSITIDIETQCPNIFTNETDTEWYLDYINLSSYKGTSAVTGYPVYLKELVVEE